MNYIHKATGQYPVSEHDIRVANPNTSFPMPFQPTDDYAGVSETEKPAFDWVTQGIRELPPELTSGVYNQAWEVFALPTEQAELNASQRDYDALQIAKSSRAAQVEAITVTTQSGNVFDGNEDAQRRMTSAITAMDDGDVLPWVLHNSTVAVVTWAELREALRLAGGAMAAIWIAPYTPA